MIQHLEYCILPGVNKTANFNYSIWIILLFWLTTTLISWWVGVGAEDHIHFGCRSFQEAWYVAKQSYNLHNPRIGEMAMYFIGIDGNGEGTYQGVWCYRLLNPALLTLGLIMLYRLSLGKWPDSSLPSLWSLSALFILVICANVGGLWWFCGNLSWTYPFVITLVFFWLAEPFFTGNYKLNIFRFAAALLCTPIVGMSNESIPFVSVVILGGTGAWWMYKNRSFKLSYQFWFILLSLLFFSFLFYVAPGRFIRSARSNWDLSWENIIWNSLFNISNWIYVTLFFWRNIVIFGLLACLVKFSKQQLNTRMLFLFIGWGLLSGILVLAPCWGGPRSFIPPELLFFAIITRLVYTLVKQGNMKRIWLYTSTQVILYSTILIPLFIGTLDSFLLWEKMEQQAERAKQNGEEVLILRNKIYDSIVPPELSFPRTLIPLYRAGEPFAKIRPNEISQVNNYKWGTPPCFHNSDLQVSDHGMNKGWAKKLGLKGIIHIEDYPPPTK